MTKIVEEACRLLGIDEATLERMARDVDKLNPELRKYFDKNLAENSSEDTVAEFEKQLEEVLKHVKSPNVGGSRSRS